MPFNLQSPYQPTGDQPIAIEKLVKGIEEHKKHQVLLGVTGSGKTFTMANVIQKVQKPTLVIAHNKTLAAQLYQEFRDFFPHNAVSYFVSYYDYYQPEAYIPSTDTYIEKDSSINDEIDKLRLAATTNLLTRDDVIVVSSVSCIYNLGSPVEYGKYLLRIVEGEVISQKTLLLQLAQLQYDRSDAELKRGSYRLRGDTIQLWPAYEDRALIIDTLENRIIRIDWIDPISGAVIKDETAQDSSGQRKKLFVIYPAKHYVIDPNSQEEAMKEIERDLELRLAELEANGRIFEAHRLKQKVGYDLEMMREFGFVGGIENYSRHFDGREPGQPPFTLIDYFHQNIKQFNKDTFLTVIDESHITVPQVKGMYFGDRARKETLVEYGFRLPSALDNRPLKLDEFLLRNPQIVHVSATPNEWEISQAGGEVVEQLIRPTGLIDSEIELRPSDNQIEDLIIEVIRRKQKGQRTLVTTLTKKMAEALTEYLNDHYKIDQLVKIFLRRQKQDQDNPNDEKIIRANEQLPIDTMEIGKIEPQYYSRATSPVDVDLSKELQYPVVAYLHSDIETLERSDILDELRRGTYDVLVGINLLREGLDLPEVTLVTILDADKEGFLRSRTSLIQTMGRAARHSEGHVILYADRLTGSMKAAISETQRRRAIQIAYNQEHGITATTISKPIRERMIEKKPDDDMKTLRLGDKNNKKYNEPFFVNLSKHERVDLNAINPTALLPADRNKLIPKLRRRMKQAANDMDFELAAILRDTLSTLETN
jgi:excinuclease ABC subunit B